MIKAETSFSLKDQLFNADTVAQLSRGLRHASRSFNSRAFEAEVLAPFAQMELKERINWIVSVLENHLPEDFGKTVQILQKALPAPLDADKTDDDFGHFIWVAPGEYVARHGCTEQHLSTSLAFLREATKRFSSEAAIRPFLREYPEPTLAFIQNCSQDQNYHVRRLASEGIRPLLPWAPRANVPVDRIIGVLDHLYQDPTRYVVRSVANTLNDITKTDAQLVVDTLQRWQKQQPGNAAEFDWLRRHALRTLLKADHPAALALLGYTAKPGFSITHLDTSRTVKVGEAFQWCCRFTSNRKQKLKLNLRIHFLKANGSHSVKVFAVKDSQFKKGETLQINKQQSFKPMTTRTLYPGTHFAELSINGLVHAKQAFELTTD